MCVVMSVACIVNVCATRLTPFCGNWLFVQISSLPFWNCALQFCGSRGACERNGYEYAPSTVLVALASAVSALPSLRSIAAGAPFDSSSAFAAKPLLLCDAVGPSSHVTFSACRAVRACQYESATMATPP